MVKRRSGRAGARNARKLVVVVHRIGFERDVYILEILPAIGDLLELITLVAPAQIQGDQHEDQCHDNKEFQQGEAAAHPGQGTRVQRSRPLPNRQPEEAAKVGRFISLRLLLGTFQGHAILWNRIAPFGNPAFCLLLPKWRLLRGHFLGGRATPCALRWVCEWTAGRGLPRPTASRELTGQPSPAEK